MAVTGKPRSFFKKFLFVVEIGGVASAGFQTCSELAAEVAVVEQWEGGTMTADKSPGRVKTTDVTLERGATEDLDLWRLWKKVVDMANNSGEVDDTYKQSFDIVQKNRDGTELRRWTLKEAWSTKFVAGAWDNSADGNTMESITFTYRYFVPGDDTA